MTRASASIEAIQSPHASAAEELISPLTVPPRLSTLLLAALMGCVVMGVITPGTPAEASVEPAGDAAASSWTTATSEGYWSLPMNGGPSVVQPFSAPPSPWAAGHRGVDLALPADADVRAPADGRVSFSGAVVSREVLSIDHGSGYVSSFEPVESEVEVGDEVSAGDVVATVSTYDDGSNHCPDQPCLHWGVRLHGEYINPLLLLGELEPSVLLPLNEG